MVMTTMMRMTTISQYDNADDDDNNDFAIITMMTKLRYYDNDDAKW